MILSVGTYMGMNIQKKLCLAETAAFEIEMRDLAQGLKPGEAKSKNIQIPCGADKVYFLGSKTDIGKTQIFEEQLLNDVVRSEADGNVFLFKKNQLIASSYARNIVVSYPSFLCLIPQSEKIDIYLESKDNAALVLPACLQKECTYVTQPQDSQQAIAALQEAKKYGEETPCELCLKNVTESFGNFVQSRSNMDLSRYYHYCKETGITTVEIKVLPKALLENITFYEHIPKDCIDDLNRYLVSDLGENVEIKADPLIMWKFEAVESEEIISYAIRTFLSENCKKGMHLTAAAKNIEGGIEVVVPNIVINSALPQNNAPILSLPDITLSAKAGKQVAIDPLRNYVSDEEPLSIIFFLLSKTNSNVVDCSIEQNRLLVCTVNKNMNASSQVTIEAFDGSLSAVQTMTISALEEAIAIVEVCGDGILQTNEACDDGNANNNDACKTNCMLNVCGDGIGDPSAEECDDGNSANGDGCSSSCKLEAALCGDGSQQTNEECDDDNTNDNDGCSSNCKIEFCGDGICNFIETCLSCNDCGFCAQSP